MRDTKSINRKYQRAVTTVKKIESVEVIESFRAGMSCPAGHGDLLKQRSDEGREGPWR